jgi:DNA repair photolyase
MSPAIRRRGTELNPTGRFERLVVEPDPEAARLEDDGTPCPVPTEYYHDRSRSLITRNDSPDIPYTFSVNPYRGCEHGCIYCYARPYHEYLGLSAGLDFETKIFVKDEAPQILKRELARRSWTGEPLAFCGVTDPYQPVERRLALTRRCLEVAADCRQPVGLITKGALITRDADLLADLARRHAALVWFTIPTMDDELRRFLEPRAPTPDARLNAMSQLSSRGIPVGVMIAPLVPGLTDHEVPAILARARSAGASFAFFTVLSLPHGVAALFDAWLQEHLPAQRTKVLGRLAQLHGGGCTTASAGRRFSGEGAMADTIGQLFHASRQRLGLADAPPPLSSDGFRRPAKALPLFEE